MVEQVQSEEGQFQSLGFHITDFIRWKTIPAMNSPRENKHWYDKLLVSSCLETRAVMSTPRLPAGEDGDSGNEDDGTSIRSEQ
jgi:hypothetical protein